MGENAGAWLRAEQKALVDLGGGVRGGAHVETFGLVARQGDRRGVLLDLCMSLPILLILAGRHPPSQVKDTVAANAINKKDLWCELCWLLESLLSILP